MKIIRTLIERWRNYKREVVESRAYDMFQIKEYKGQLWFTYAACLVCPCDMFKDEGTKAVERMREMYKERELGV